jgi:hypothetical protein
MYEFDEETLYTAGRGNCTKENMAFPLMRVRVMISSLGQGQHVEPCFL